MFLGKDGVWYVFYKHDNIILLIITVVQWNSVWCSREYSNSYTFIQ